MPNSMPRIAPGFQDGALQTDPPWKGKEWRGPDPVGIKEKMPGFPTKTAGTPTNRGKARRYNPFR